jgi:DNA-binding NarL/FixJ family response regulator
VSAQIIPFPLAEVAPARPEPSRAELELVRFVAEGFSTQEIAEQFDVPDHTVDALLDDVLDKLHARSLAHGVATCLRRGLIG